MIKSVLVIFFMIIVLIIPVSASQNDITVIKDISYLSIQANANFTIDSFDNNENYWKPSENIDKLVILDNSLEVKYIGMKANSSKSIIREFIEPLDLSNHKYFSYAINCPKITDSSYFTIVTIYSTNNDSKEYIVGISPDSWNGVYIDISGWENKKSISKIKISMYSDYDSEQIFTNSFKIDSINASSTKNIEYNMLFMSDNYMSLNGTLNYNNKFLDFIVDDTNPFIESNIVNYDFSEIANSIKIKLKNNTKCESIKMYYCTSSNPDFSEDKSAVAKIDVNDQIQTIYFPLKNDNISKIKFVFEGVVNGNIEIYSISFASSYLNNSFTIGNIEICKVLSNKSEIIIRGSIPYNYVNMFLDSNLVLHELSPDKDESVISTYKLNPIDQTSLARQFEFKIPLYDGDKSRLYSKFIVTLDNKNDKNQLVFVDTPKYIINPEILSTSEWKYPVIDSIKGLQTNLTSEAQKLGIKNTVIPIDYSKLVSSNDNGYEYVFENETFYFNRNVVNQLDSQISTFYHANINVSLLINSQDLKSPTIGIKYIKATTNYLASRYSSDGTSFGRVINYVVDYKNTGENKNLNEYIKNFADTFRIIYNSVKSNSLNAKLFILLGNQWDKNLPVDYVDVYDNRAVIDVFNSRLIDEGIINWNIAWDPYTHSIDNKYSTPDIETDYITVENIEVLSNYLKHPDFYYNGQKRRIMILESSVKPKTAISSDFVNQAADYVYSYYKLSSLQDSLIDSFIINREINFNDVFQYIDTNYSLEYTAFAIETLKINDWIEVIPHFNINKIIKRNTSESKLTNSIPQNIRGSLTLWNFSDDTVGWVASDYCSSLKTGDLYNRKNILIAQMKNNNSNEYMGITNRFDDHINFNLMPYINMDVQIDMLPEDVKEVEYNVTVYSNDDSMTASSIIKVGQWNDAILDVSSFVGVKTVDCMKIWIRGINGENIGTPILMIGEISGLSTLYDNNSLVKAIDNEKEKEEVINNTVIWILIITIIITSTIGMIYILSKKKNMDK